MTVLRRAHELEHIGLMLLVLIWLMNGFIPRSAEQLSFPPRYQSAIRQSDLQCLCHAMHLHCPTRAVEIKRD